MLAAIMVLSLSLLSVVTAATGQEQGTPLPPYYPPDPFELKGIHLKSSPVNENRGESPVPGQNGQVMGKVVERDSRGNPDESKGIAGAQIQVYDGYSTRTCISGPDGTFYLEGVQPGRASLTITMRGYRQAGGPVEITALPRRVLVALTSLHSNHSRQKGYINVFAYNKEDGHGKIIPVTSIRVHESGGSRRWYNSWSGPGGGAYQSLYCSNAPVGSYYTIKATWEDGTERTSEIRLRQKYRDVSIYP